MWLNQEQYEQVLSQLYQFRADELLYKRRYQLLQNSDSAKLSANSGLYSFLSAAQIDKEESLFSKDGANSHPKSRTLSQLFSAAESQLTTQSTATLLAQSRAGDGLVSQVISNIQTQSTAGAGVVSQATSNTLAQATAEVKPQVTADTLIQSTLETTIYSVSQSTPEPSVLSTKQANPESNINNTALAPAQLITSSISHASPHRLISPIQVFIRSLSKADLELIQREKMIIPELCSKKPDLITEEFYFNPHGALAITVLKHYRYTPVFEHRHVFFELVYVLSGRCQQIIMDQKIECQAGDFYLIGPDTKHSLDVHQDDTIVLNILIRRSAIEFALPDILCGNNVLSQFFNQNLFSRSVNPYLLIATSRNLNSVKQYQISSDMTERAVVNAAECVSEHSVNKSTDRLANQSVEGETEGLADHSVSKSSKRSTAQTIEQVVSNEHLLNSEHYMSIAPQRKFNHEQHMLDDAQIKLHDAQKLEDDEQSRQNVRQSRVNNRQSQHSDDRESSQSIHINTANTTTSKTSQSMIAQLVVAMYWESLHPRAYSDKKLNGGLMLLFSILLQDYASQMILPHCKRSTDQFMSAVYDYLEENFKDASLHDLSQRLNLCEAHVSRKIRKACSQSFSSLRQDLIFSKVCVLLEHSNLSATAISEMMGFNTVEHFYRQFKKRYGITCNEYRQRYAPHQLKMSVALP